MAGRYAILYTYVARGPLSDAYASRFVNSWHEFPPGHECDLIVISNGGPATVEAQVTFCPLGAEFFPTDNTGWDIGGYLKAARGPARDYAAVLLCGESVHFWREGWLRRLLEAWAEYGEGVYGTAASYNVRPHLHTTCLLSSPALLAAYPYQVRDKRQRYDFEHGPLAFWVFVHERRRRPAMLVTWDGVWSWREWRRPDNGLWRGDQSNCLVRTIHMDRFDAARPEVRALWDRNASALR